MQNSKWLVQKIAEVLIGKTGDLIGNKIAAKIVSVGKRKNKGKEKEDETNKRQQIYIPP